MLRKEAGLARVSFFTMICQTLAFKVRTGLEPRYYVVAGMARKHFPTSDKWHHISDKEFRRAFNILPPPPTENSPSISCARKHFTATCHIPTATARGYFHPHKGLTVSGNELRSTAQLDSLLHELDGLGICLKPVEGCGGNGILIGDISSDERQATLTLADTGKKLDATAIIKAFTGTHLLPEFIIEERVVQSSEFSAFNPSSLNTIRAWVLTDQDGLTTVIGAHLRIGRAGSTVDNASAGGLICPIDLNSGILGAGITKHTPHRDDFTHHPVHGATLAGHSIEQWSTIQHFACETLSRLPGIRFAGLDIAMTPQGPLLIETNPEPDKDGAAHANIPSRRLKEVAQALRK